MFPLPVVPSAACGAVCASVRTTLRARLRLWSCVALQCDLLISQHATSCSAVASDSARCHDAVCGLQRRNQVLTKRAATRQWQTHFATYYRPQPPFPRGAGGVGTMVTLYYPLSPSIPQEVGRLAVTLCYHSPKKIGNHGPPSTPIPQGGGGFVRSHCATFLTEHDHCGGGGLGGGGGQGSLEHNIYKYIFYNIHV